MIAHTQIMGAQWKQAGREAAALKKGQVVGKLVREIIISAKLGGGDPDLNARLAAAVEKAGEIAKTKGCKRAIPLPVSTPNHSPMLAPAGEKMREALAAAGVAGAQKPTPAKAPALEASAMLPTLAPRKA